MTFALRVASLRQPNSGDTKLGRGREFSSTSENW